MLLSNWQYVVNLKGRVFELTSYEGKCIFMQEQTDSYDWDFRHCLSEAHVCLYLSCNFLFPNSHIKQYLCSQIMIDTVFGMKKYNSYKFVLMSFCATLLCSACSVGKFLADGEYLLDKVEINADNKDVKTSELIPYLRQTPNSRWFNRFKVPMYIYSISGLDSTRSWNKLWRRLGEEPVIFSESKAEETRIQIQNAVRNKGYLRATVTKEPVISKHKLKMRYHVHSDTAYTIGSFRRNYSDTAIAQILMPDTLNSLLKVGDKLDVNKLDEERQRLTRILQSRGYFTFHKEYFSYQADTIKGEKAVALTLLQQNNPYNNEQVRPEVYRLRNINFLLDTETIEQFEETPSEYRSIKRNPYSIYYKGKQPFLRQSTLYDFNRLVPDTLYNYKDVEASYSALGRLGILKGYNIRFRESKEYARELDAYVMLSRHKNKAISFEIEGTNSAGDLGVAAGVGFTHRNVFRGAEVFNVKLRGAYETVTGLEDYAGSNYKEYGVETSLSFPEFKFPFLSRKFKHRIAATSEVNAKYNWQIRPEFSRTVASAGWSYKWNARQKYNHRFDLLDISYIYMPYRSQTFIDYLDSMDEINPLLRFSYENQLIVRMGYTFTYNSVGGTALQASRRNSYSIRLNVEEAGNILYAFSKAVNKRPKEGEAYKMANINFAQYLKADAEFTKNYFIDERNALVFHAGIGIAYPYANSKILPFEKLYFSGGANSVRGWRVRSLGPGGYAGTEGSLDYVNHTGDLKLDLNMEYRTHLFWKLNGALFVDAGNVWTLRNRAMQPEGAFKFNRLFKQIAMAYGVGLRFDFDFLILRFDAGMKAVNPMYSGKDRYPIISPRLKRDFAFHFAVGYPF